VSRRFIINGIALVIGIVLGAYFMADRAPTESEVAAGSQALGRLPQFSLPDLEGTPHPSSRWAGKVLVLNFWATWCPPCLREIPEFMALQEEFGEQGLQFVGIAVDSPDAVRDFVTERQINYPILIGDQEAVRLSKQLGNRFEGLPFSVIFDRQGAAIHVQAGELKQDTIREKISNLL